MGRHPGTLLYVDPGGHVRCSTRMGNRTLIIITIITITILLTTTTHPQVVGPHGIADGLHQDKGRAKARLRVLVLSRRWLLLMKVVTMSLALYSYPALLSPVTVVMVTLTPGSEVTDRGSQSERNRTLHLMQTRKKVQHMSRCRKAYQKIL